MIVLLDMSSPRVFFDVYADSTSLGRVVFELFDNECPKTCENFRALCTMEKGYGYKSSILHRVIRGYFCQGGDFTSYNGTGGKSIFGKKFEDENFNRKFTIPGLLAMANQGSNTNTSQFFVTILPCPWLNGKNVVFGQVVEGMDVIKQIETYGSETGVPTRRILIQECAYSQNCSDYYTCQLELYDRLLAKSRPSIRPIQNDLQKINVNLGFSLIRLVSVNEDDSLITIRGHINQTWNASVLGWNSTPYANVQHIRVPAHSIWTPKIELINPSTTIDSEANHFIDVQSSGHFELSYSTLLTSPCNFDLKNFPFDQQTCTFKFGSVLYDIDEVSISQAIDFIIDEPDLMPNGFYFVSHTVNQKVTFFAGFDRSYDQISIQLNIHRRPTYFVRLINWPGVILIFLTLTIFFLPPSASERICYGVLLLICQFILLIIFAYYVPKRLGTSWPLMGYTIFYDICLTSMVLALSVLTRMLVDGKHYSIERPSNKIRTVFFCHLTKLVGLKRILYATLITNRENEYDTNDLPNNDSAMEPLTSLSNGLITTSDPLVLSSNTISRDITSIKQKVNILLNEHNIHQEWILLAHIINRLCFIIYLFLFSFSIGNHLFHT
ncbi:unnamed protein product [Rotaria sordida]|uniref:peptidylprolyl isomerase n=1 Tax=Rotaria sordida TaxID=392033 RepID=A0A813TAB6_9BILA|nr:unnamed protein product [Rotaria sordida]CAF0863787.1 unnamed protein product [Rotaria sordida]